MSDHRGDAMPEPLAAISADENRIFRTAIRLSVGLPLAVFGLWSFAMFERSWGRWTLRIEDAGLFGGTFAPLVGVFTGAAAIMTEYLIARIGRMLPLRVATGRLARIDRGGATPDVRFMSRYFLQPDESLLHGVELVAQCFGMERGAVEKEVRTTEEERSLYTVDFVDAVLRDFGREPAVYQSLRDGFTRMIAFDALVGAVDRHASNWGVIEHLPRVRPPRFAPVFDTARGLLLRYSDDELREQTATPAAARAFIETFALRAHPLVGVPGVRNVSYFDLTAHMVSRGEEFGKPVRSIVYAFHPHRVRAMMHREFHSLLHPVRLRLIYELLRYRHGRLMDVCQRSKHTS